MSAKWIESGFDLQQDGSEFELQLEIFPWWPQFFFAGKWQETHSSNPGYLHGGSGAVPTGSGRPLDEPTQ